MSEQDSLVSQADIVHPTVRAGHLIRQAMHCFETDRVAAWRCLHDASSLLGSEPVELRASPDAPRSGGLPRWRAKRALAYIEANLGSKLAIGEMAGIVALSKGHFSRAFKQTLGFSPMNYVATRRVERAKLMMTTKRGPLGDIALACGLADQSHLNRYFRRVVGMSPGLWRRRLPTPKTDVGRV